MDLQRGRLRMITGDDLAQILGWRNSERIRKEMFTEHIISWEEHLAWFEKSLSSGNHHLVFELDGNPAGVSSFTGIDAQNNHCSWGFYLGESPLPRGTGIMLGIYSMQYAFDILKVHRVCSEVLASNPISLAFHSKMGFCREGILREHIKKADGFVDVVCFGQLYEEWTRNCAVLTKKLATEY